MAIACYFGNRFPQVTNTALDPMSSRSLVRMLHQLHQLLQLYQLLCQSRQRLLWCTRPKPSSSEKTQANWRPLGGHSCTCKLFKRRTRMVPVARVVSRVVATRILSPKQHPRRLQRCQACRRSLQGRCQLYLASSRSSSA